MQKAPYTIRINHCNNISDCNIAILQNNLNIKYAINGTGKSTIAKAIKLAAESSPLTPLRPFSHIARSEKELMPTVSTLPFKKVAVFNSDYLKQYVYQKNDLLKNTFEVLINSDEYLGLKSKIDEDLKSIRDIARDTPNVNRIKSVLSNILKHILVNNDGKTLSKKNKGIKSLLDGNKGAIFNPPESLKVFSSFFDDEKSVEWAAWKLKGINLFGQKEICPYCAADETEEKKQQTKEFQDTFDEASINYASQLKDYLISIATYINTEKLDMLLSIINHKSDRATLQMELVKLRAEVDYLLSSLESLSYFDGYSIDRENIDKLEAKLQSMKIAKEHLDFFNTEPFLSEILPLNTQIDKLVVMIGRLKGEIVKFRLYLESQISQRKDDINSFLQSAGFKYSFDIIVEGDNNAHAVLQYKEKEIEHIINSPDEHLSWGERNAFALLLFMYDAISKDADLIILDDPISSFDSNKKYAIINRLFQTGVPGNSLYQKTVLLLTHDFEPIIDYIQVGGKVSGDSVCAYYLYNENGNVKEKLLLKNQDIMSMIVMLKELARDASIHIPVRIGCLRKYFEHTIKDPRINSIAYNILSSIVHGRKCPTYDNEGLCKIADPEKDAGLQEIREYIRDFDYDNALAIFDNNTLLRMYKEEENAFFQLLVLRAYIDSNEDARERLKLENDVLRKYVDETYHIENDYMYSLDVRQFNIIPQYYSENANLFVEQEIARFAPKSAFVIDYNSHTDAVIYKVDLYEMPAAAGIGSDFLDTVIQEKAIETVHADCTYAVRISGDSMEPDILDQSIVLIRECEEIPNRHIGLFNLNGQALCKRLNILESRIELESINKDYSPIVIANDDNLKVFGEVIDTMIAASLS
jgi:SOS-response transcriptional repressor LexA/energy-coupling factor transporter ATP-binding protein EcfA2